MKNTINEWQKECESFQSWFKKLGGNIANDEQMTEAFLKIEAKNISDNNLYRLLDEERAKGIEVKFSEVVSNN